jgi:SAM-dependent methyltransferase
MIFALRRTRADAALLAAMAILYLACPAALAQTSHTHDHRFTDAERWARHFDDPARDAWQQPHRVIRALDLAPTAKIADIGAGTGYFAVRLALMTPGGRVYAVDAEPDMVRYLGERARREQLENLVAVQGGADHPRLPEKVDRVLLVDVYHHLRDRERYFARLRENLLPGATVAIIDFRSESPIGPPARVRVSAQQVRSELERAGYTLAATHDFLPRQFFLVFAPRTAVSPRVPAS